MLNKIINREIKGFVAFATSCLIHKEIYTIFNEFWNIIK